MELNKRITISKILLTLGALEFFGPILRDTNSSHLLNPEWVGHARFHLMWCISLWGSMGIFSLLVLWRNPITESKPLYLVMTLQLLNAIAFWSSTLFSDFYRGDIFDAKIHVGVMNLNENIIVFSALSLFLLFNYWYVKVKIDPLFKELEHKDSPNESVIKTDVLISGGGPSGMIAAIYLSKLGIPNTLVERRNDIQMHPKAHELSSRSLEILASLGIPIDKLIKVASDHETASRILFCNTINDEIGRIDLSERKIKEKYDLHLSSSTPFLNISQTEFEKVLRDYLKNQKLTTVLLNHQWISATEEKEIDSIVLNRQSNQKMIIRSKYLISADGARSTCRTQLGIKMNGPEKIQDVVNAYFTNDMSKIVKTKAKLYWIFNPQAPGVFIAHHPEKRWVYHHPIETPFQNIKNFDESYFQNKMRKAMGLKDDFKFDIESISSWRMTAQIAEKFRNGNIFLIGDAAHRFPPTGGLGMNSCIGDAQNLCWKLAAVIQGNANPSLLDTYESERKPILQKNCKESKKNWLRILDVPKSLGLNPYLGQLLDRILNSMFMKWIPQKKRLLLDTFLRNKAEKILIQNLRNPENISKISKSISDQTGHFDRLGLDLGYCYHSQTRQTDSEPLVSEYIPSTDVGNRFPHFWLDQKKKTSSLSLLSATQFTLIIYESSKWNKLWHKLKTESKSQIQFKIETIQMPSNKDNSRIKSLLDISEDGALLIRPDGHVAWKMKDSLGETDLKKMFLEVTSQILNPTLLEEPRYNQILNKIGSKKMFTSIVLVVLPLVFFAYYLFRPLEHKPQPAEFKALSLSNGRFESFNPKPNYIFGMGLVYSKHIIETAASFDPKVPPPIFIKEHKSLNPKGGNVSLPDTKELLNAIQSFEPSLKQNDKLSKFDLKPLLDYEVELAFVLLENINQKDLENPNYAPKLGFFIANDLSARSLAVFGEGLENRAEYWGVSKSFPGFLPISSKIWISNIHYSNGLPDIKLETYVNGNLRQSESTLNMIYTPKEMLRFIQNKYPDYKIKKGDIVITGTPGGVALSTPKAIARLFDLFHVGRFTKLKMLLSKDDSRFLKLGDEVIVKGVGLGEVKSQITNVK